MVWSQLSSARELLLLTMTVSMCMLICAGMAYALEKDEPDTMFYTLPQVRPRVSRVTCNMSRVTCPDPVLGDHHDDEHRLRRHRPHHGAGEAGGEHLLHLRHPQHHAAHPHHRGQLQQVLVTM